MKPIFIPESGDFFLNGYWERSKKLGGIGQYLKKRDRSNQLSY
jgi:hypothetical protein